MTCQKYVFYFSRYETGYRDFVHEGGVTTLRASPDLESWWKPQTCIYFWKVQRKGFFMVPTFHMPSPLSSELHALEIRACQNLSRNPVRNGRIWSFMMFLRHFWRFFGHPKLFSIIFFKSEPIWSKSYVDFVHFDWFQALSIWERFQLVVILAWYHFDQLLPLLS